MTRHCTESNALLCADKLQLPRQHLIQHLRQGRDRALDIAQLIQPEQVHAEGLEVCRFVALQRYASGELQVLGYEFAAVLDPHIGGVADHHAGRFEAICGDAFKPLAGQQQAVCARDRPVPVAGCAHW